MLTHEGNVADGPGETIFMVKDGVIYTPDLSTGILHGITRDTIIEIARDARLHGAREDADPLRPLPRRRGVHVRHGRRGDADPLGRRPRDRAPAPITREMQQAYLDTVRGRKPQWADWLDYQTRTPAQA